MPTRRRPGHRGAPGPPAARRRPAARPIAGASIAGASIAVVIAVFIAVVALLLAGCSADDDQPVLIDGLSIGVLAGCGACDQPNTSDLCGACESLATIAARHLDKASPGHPAVIATAFYREGRYRQPNGELAIMTRSGSLTIAVVTFVDGTRHAIAVYCGVGGCRSLD
ncbi:MAG TPA: hypothetical protein VN773_00310 [Verrucomicrobiae bacterium]|nr:hypothetical protein [Verrucomicrobiae bacterium]